MFVATRARARAGERVAKVLKCLPAARGWQGGCLEFSVQRCNAAPFIWRCRPCQNFVDSAPLIAFAFMASE